MIRMLNPRYLPVLFMFWISLSPLYAVGGSDSATVFRLLDEARNLRTTNRDSAYKLAELAYHLTIKSGDPKLMILVNNRFADSYYDNGNAVLALEFYLKSYHILQAEAQKRKSSLGKRDVYSRMVPTMNNIANCYSYLRRNQLALEYVQQALLMHDSAEGAFPGLFPSSYKLSLLLNTGSMFLKANDNAKAKDYFSQASMVNQEVNDTSIWAVIFNNLGVVYQNLGTLDTSYQYFHKALYYSELSGNRAGTASALNNIGKYYYLNGDLRNSILQYQKAMSAAKEYGVIPSYLNAIENLAMIYPEVGDYREAYAMAQLYMLLSDSLLNQDKTDDLTRMASQFEFESRVKFIEYELQHQISIERRRQNFLLAISGIFLLLILVVFLSWRNQRIKHRLAKERTEKLLIDQKAGDLEREIIRHELQQKNKELATSAMYLIQKNELIADIASRLNGISKDGNGDGLKELSIIVRQMLNHAGDRSWKEFELRFEQVHQGFYDKLQIRFPALTPAEKKLAALLKLNLTSKDIAALTGNTPDSVKIARSRLRKKLGLQPEENLVKFLEGL
jgi:tetratricopeptide (TPR) repeat protein